MLKKIISEIKSQFPESERLEVFQEKNANLDTFWFQLYPTLHYLIEIEVVDIYFIKIRCIHFEDVSMLIDFIGGLREFNVFNNTEWEPVAFPRIEKPSDIVMNIESMRAAVEAHGSFHTTYG